jgi:hypothetical protein
MIPGDLRIGIGRDSWRREELVGTGEGEGIEAKWGGGEQYTDTRIE